MSDPKIDPAPPTDPPKPTPPAGDPPKSDPPKPDDSALGDAGKAAIAVERKARSDAEKANKTLAARVKEFEDRDKSDADKFAERLATAEKAATDASGRLVRYEVAVEKQVPAHLMEFVTGASREDVEASVTKVLAAFASSKPTGPRVDPSQGAGGQPVGLDEQIKAAQAKGDVREAIRLKSRKSITTN